MNALRALQHRPFALLWTGQTISRLGDSFYHIALAWWVLEKTGSAVAMGSVLIFSQIPMLLFLLVGGVVVDRLPRIRVMLVSDVLGGLVVSLVALFSWMNVLEIWHIYIASMLFGFVEAFFIPAYQAVIPELVPVETLTSANSLSGLSVRVSGIVGPALGAALVAAGGTSLTFALDGLSFFVSAAFVLPIVRQGLDQLQAKAAQAAGKLPVREALSRGFADLRDGFKFIVTVPWIWVSIALWAFINITESGPRAVALPFLIEQNLGGDVSLLGWFGSASSLGFVIGMLWLGQYARLHRRGLLAYAAAIAMGAVMLPLAFLLPVPLLIVSMLLGGLATSVISLIWTTTLQELVPKDLLGRVFSIDALGSFVLLPIGYGLAGLMTDATGAPTVFLVGAVGTMLLAALGLLHPAIRALD